jgi:arsenical pump membrane protein
VSEAAALLVLAASLAAAITRPRWAPDWAVAAGGAVLLLVLGVLSFGDARHTAARFGPTIGFLAALLVLGDGCRRAGLFDALGAIMATRTAGVPRRLLAMVFVVAAGTTAVLSLDATVVLLTPVVLSTAVRLRTSLRPHVYACTHLANSASLLLPVSNLTNLLAFQAVGLSFARFGALMALPWVAAVAVEWLVLTRAFAADLATGVAADARPGAHARLPRFACAVLVLALLGFGLSSLLAIPPAWIAAAAAAAMVARVRPAPLALVRSAEPAFLVFVLALAIVVQGASQHGLSSTMASLLPHGVGLLALLAVAGLSALLANLVNNLPATLIVLPVAAASGPGAVLAMLIGVGIGPNLTYAGSLATLLWRRVVAAHEETVALGDFLRLGVATVPLALVASTVGLWLALRVI